MIQEIRKKHNFTQEQLASYLGVSYTTINRWEKNKTKPSKKHENMLKKLEQNLSNNSSEEIDYLRPIQYLGSKKRLLSEISNIIGSLVSDSSVVCDLFSGSGVVSNILSTKYNIVSIDIQKYSSILSESLITPFTLDENKIKPILENIENNIELNKFIKVFEPLINYENKCIELGKNLQGENLANFIEDCSVYKFLNSQVNLISKELLDCLLLVKDNLATTDKSLKDNMLITTYYGGIYFSFYQSVIMDFILYKSRIIFTEEEYNQILAVMLSTASQIVNTVGKQFAQPIKLTDSKGKVKKLLLERTIRDRTLSVQQSFIFWLKKYKINSKETKKSHKFFNIDFNEFLNSYNGKIDCFYADPPYTIDHYSRFYHVLESICKYDYPEIDTKTRNGKTEFMRGMYRVDRHQSPFSITSKVKEAFNNLFEGVKKFNAPLVLSYSPSNIDKNGRARLLELNEIESLAKNYFPHVYFIEPKKHTHRKLNSSNRNSEVFENAEIFIVCTLKEVNNWKNI